MADAAPLSGARVLITRPRAQAEGLARAIRADGGEPVLFPLIDILPVSDPARLDTILATLDRFDLAIFISPNAVQFALTHLSARARSWPASLPIAVIGAGTAQALATHDLHATIVPRERFDSEALLAEPALQAVAGRRILILRGEGGRALLADTLTARGATVTYAECYRRAPPPPDAHAGQWLAPGAIDIAVFTSRDALDNLLQLYGEAGDRLLRDTQTLVVSTRLAEQITRHQPRHAPLIARAGDTELMHALRTWRLGQKTL